MKKIRMIIVLCMVGLALMLNTSCEKKELTESEKVKCEIEYTKACEQSTHLYKSGIIGYGQYTSQLELNMEAYQKCIEKEENDKK